MISTAHTIATPVGPIIKLFIPSAYARLVPGALGIKNCGSADQVPLVRANLLLFHESDEFMAKIAAQRIVLHLARARFVVMKKPPLGGPVRTRI